MNLEIAGRVAMIAAGSKGLGKACAKALMQEGVKVSICARNQEELKQTASELSELGEIITFVADVSSLQQIEAWHKDTVSKLGAVDILVTNTGGPAVSKFMSLTDEQWHSGVESTLMNVVRLSRLVIPGMLQKKWGKIIHLTSLVAKQPREELTISSTLRAGISGLTKTMANEFGAHGITVNSILTGHIMTDRQLHLAEIKCKERGITREQYFEEQSAQIPMKRIGEPREVGEVVAFLASERASYLTGVSLQIDGGLIKSTM